MPNGQMDAIQVQNPVAGEQRALSPRFILLSQRLVQTAHCAGAGCNPHEGGGDFSDFMRAGATHKHLGQRFGDLGFIAVIALEDLGVKLPFSISGNFQIFNAPCWGHQITGIGTITISAATGSTFSPRCSNALFQLFTHDLFDQDLHGTYGKTA